MNKINITGVNLKKFTEQDTLDYCLLNNINPNNITALDLSHNELTDISGIKLFKNLEELILPYNKIVNISVLKDLNNLKTLDMESNEINDISVLKKMKYLQLLILGYNNIKKLSNIKHLKNLVYLNLGNNKLTDIFELKYLNKLQILKLNHNNLIKNISVIKDLTDLKTLDIRSLELESDQIQYIKSLKNLENLWCGSGFKDMSILKKLNKRVYIYE